MTERPDLYAVLGVPPGATQAEISHAYRALLRRHHPDTRAPDDESRGVVSDTALQRVLAAYTVLRDPARRAHYDNEFRTESTEKAHAGRREPQRPPGNYRECGQPPIIAGPVRWHQAR